MKLRTVVKTRHTKLSHNFKMDLHYSASAIDVRYFFIPMYGLTNNQNKWLIFFLLLFSDPRLGLNKWHRIGLFLLFYSLE